MRKKVVLAIDLGTTGNRVIAFSKDGEIVAKSYYEISQIFPQPGWVEQDPQEVIFTTYKALQDVLKKVGIDNVVSIGITNQRETTILWDKDTGKPLYNAIVWQCRRTEDICKELAEYKGLIKEKTGLFLDPYFSATKIKWIIDNIEGVKGKINQNRVLFGTPESWLLWNLTEGKSFFTEPSNASRTLLFNIHSLEFDKELLNIFGIPESILPQVVDSDSFFGYTSRKITGKQIPIMGILGDQQASLFAHCGWEKGVVKNTYGTGLFIMTNTKDSLIQSDSLITTISWKIERKVEYALEGSIFMGGAVIQWLRDNLKIIKTAPDSEQIAQALRDNEGVYFVPALQGLGAPYWRPEAKGMILGLTRKTTREHLVRAALESLAFQTKDVVEEIKKLVPFQLKILKVDGGASLNNFLMQFQADILGFEVERPKIIENTALGIAGLSGVVVGFWNRDEFEKVIKIDKRFSPHMDEEKRIRLYTQWKKAIEVLSKFS